MKKINQLKYYILVVMAVCVASLNAQDTTRVLFIGNSHTYTNDLPLLFANLSESGGRPVITDSSTPGGYTLEQHTTNPTTIDKITLGIWDYVVLQENSMYPAIEYTRYNSMYPASRYLDSLIIENDGNTAFFLTWGWRYGGQFDIDGHESPVFEDYFEMQDTLTSAYTEIAAELDAVLVPAGVAWATAVTWDPELVLWAPDNYHPALNGSYLAACVFYATFFDSSPVGLEYTAGLDPAEALFLQQAAWSIMTGIEDQPAGIPSSFELKQNYPNPFNSSTVISYNLPEDAQVILKIYDILGREIKTLVNSYQNAGRQLIAWDGTDNTGQSVSSGVYFYRVQADDNFDIRKMVYIR
jgi:hypothetical protein